jgi:hypothetical protein
MNVILFGMVRTFFKPGLGSLLEMKIVVRPLTPTSLVFPLEMNTVKRSLTTPPPTPPTSLVFYLIFDCGVNS